MGPQHVRCGMIGKAFNIDPDSVLQWGRNMFVVECAEFTKRLHAGFDLQWGRNMFVAECRGA